MSKAERIFKGLGLGNYVSSIKSNSLKEIKHFKYAASILGTGIFSFAVYLYFAERNIRMKQDQLYTTLVSSPVINLNSLSRANSSGENINLIDNISKDNYKHFYFMKQAKITGYFDHTKEILVYRKQNGVEGYDVLTPFYFMDYVNSSANVEKGFKELYPDFAIVKGGIAVNRGW